MNKNKPSVFKTDRIITKDKLWKKIITELPETIASEANQYNSEIIEPYPGLMEFIIKSKNNKSLAIAITSEIKDDGIDWSIYYEN